MGPYHGTLPGISCEGMETDRAHSPDGGPVTIHSTCINRVADYKSLMILVLKM